MQGWIHLGIILGIIAMPMGASASSQMVLIPEGRYQPFYTVNSQAIQVKRFYLDQYPVTNENFREFLKTRPRWWRSRVKPIFAEKDYLKHWQSDVSFPSHLAQSPVTYVSWFAAKAYCQAQNKHLPSGDQWEMAALASENSPNAARNKAFRQRILDWYGQPTPEIIPSIHTGFKNYYGVYGIHGLVWEWVRDFNTVLVTGESRGDQGLNRNLFCAGGSVGSPDPSDYASYMRYAFRSSLQANYVIKNLGFRCARESQ